MAILGFRLEEIARLLALLEAHSLDEIVLEEEGRSLRIKAARPERAGGPALSEAPPVAPRTRRTVAAASVETLPETEISADQVALSSPMMGLFYRADKPGAPPLIEVGDRVAVGQAIGIIEAMKVFSEIPAEHAGTVLSILAQDGQLVQAGEPLMILRRE
ncbi:MAG TPA: biotin/lipoyl-containing protein [Chthonomonadaceae bacterium]|nr:biotin/lipoyl-containing protein [Chthonomonadaceae bacterium]